MQMILCCGYIDSNKLIWLIFFSLETKCKVRTEDKLRLYDPQHKMFLTVKTKEFLLILFFKLKVECPVIMVGIHDFFVVFLWRT